MPSSAVYLPAYLCLSAACLPVWFRMGHMLGLSAHLRRQEVLAAAWRSKVEVQSGGPKWRSKVGARLPVTRPARGWAGRRKAAAGHFRGEG